MDQNHIGGVIFGLSNYPEKGDREKSTHTLSVPFRLQYTNVLLSPTPPNTGRPLSLLLLDSESAPLTPVNDSFLDPTGQ